MKSGTLTQPFAITTSDEVIAARRDALATAILPPPVYRGSFSAVVSKAILALAVPSLIVIDTQNLNVAVAAGTSGLSSGVHAALSALDANFRSIEPSDPSARSANIVVKDQAGTVVSSGVSTPEGQSELDVKLDLMLGASETQKSLASLADAMADALEAINCKGFIVLDQLGQTVRMYNLGTSVGSNTAKGIIDAVTANSTIAVFHVEPDAATGGAGFFSL